MVQLFKEGTYNAIKRAFCVHILRDEDVDVTKYNPTDQPFVPNQLRDVNYRMQTMTAEAHWNFPQDQYQNWSSNWDGFAEAIVRESRNSAELEHWKNLPLEEAREYRWCRLTYGSNNVDTFIYPDSGGEIEVDNNNIVKLLGISDPNGSLNPQRMTLKNGRSVFDSSRSLPKTEEGRQTMTKKQRIEAHDGRKLSDRRTIGSKDITRLVGMQLSEESRTEDENEKFAFRLYEHMQLLPAAELLKRGIDILVDAVKRQADDKAADGEPSAIVAASVAASLPLGTKLARTGIYFVYTLVKQAVQNASAKDRVPLEHIEASHEFRQVCVYVITKLPLTYDDCQLEPKQREQIQREVEYVLETAVTCWEMLLLNGRTFQTEGPGKKTSWTWFPDTHQKLKNVLQNSMVDKFLYEGDASEGDTAEGDTSKAFGRYFDEIKLPHTNAVYVSVHKRLGNILKMLFDYVVPRYARTDFKGLVVDTAEGKATAEGVVVRIFHVVRRLCLHDAPYVAVRTTQLGLKNESITEAFAKCDSQGGHHVIPAFLTTTLLLLGGEPIESDLIDDPLLDTDATINWTDNWNDIMAPNDDESDR
jgi:hypothetical protein